MKFILIGTDSYYILEEYKSNFSSISDSSILRKYDDVCWKCNQSNKAYSLEDVTKDYNMMINDYKIVPNIILKNNIDYFKDVLSLMKSYQRDIKIDKVLAKYNDYDLLCYAC